MAFSGLMGRLARTMALRVERGMRVSRATRVRGRPRSRRPRWRMRPGWVGVRVVAVFVAGLQFANFLVADVQGVARFCG